MPMNSFLNEFIFELCIIYIYIYILYIILYYIYNILFLYWKVKLQDFRKFFGNGKLTVQIPKSIFSAN